LNVTGAGEAGEKELSIEEVVEYSYQTPEVTTDLQDGAFVRIQFQILTDGEDTHNEVSHREFQIVNILIKELALMNEENFSFGLDGLEQILKEKLNEIITVGEITDVYTINKILQ